MNVSYIDYSNLEESLTIIKPWYYKDIEAIYGTGNLLGYDLDYDLEAVRNSLRNIFLVNQLESPGKPKFGNPLRIDLFDLFDFFTEQTLVAAIENVIARYEPRVQITNILIDLLPEYNRVIIQIEYEMLIQDIVTTDSLSIPYAHNTLTFMDGREGGAEVPRAASGTCGQTSPGLA